jgi:uncharacterized peroxidase-related enzyme
MHHHGAGLRRLLRARTNEEQDKLIAALTSDYRLADLAPTERVMLDYAVKLTKTPGQITRDDVEGLRQVGFDFRSIHDICAITAYYAFANRIVDGLGVELEEGAT